jgi:hypothetical protein
MRFKYYLFYFNIFLKKYYFFLKKKNNFFRKKNYHGNLIVNSAKSYNNFLLNLNHNIHYNNIFLIFFFKNLTNGMPVAAVKSFLGFFFFIKIANGLFLSDLIIFFFYPMKFFKKYILGSKSFLFCLMEYFYIFELFLYNNKSSNYSRSAGTYCQILSFFFETGLVLLILPSKKKIYMNVFSFCTIGRVSNYLNKYTVTGNSKFLKFFKKKPSVRGVAKNPIDHPHGGRTKTVQPEVSPWG